VLEIGCCRLSSTLPMGHRKHRAARRCVSCVCRLTGKEWEEPNPDFFPFGVLSSSCFQAAAASLISASVGDATAAIPIEDAIDASEPCSCPVSAFDDIGIGFCFAWLLAYFLDQPCDHLGSCFTLQSHPIRRRHREQVSRHSQ